MTNRSGLIRMACPGMVGVASKLFCQGHISSLNAVETIRGEKVAHVSITFPRGSLEGCEASEMVLPFYLSWEAFQKLLPKID